MPKNATDLETPVGTLSGRDAIYLDDTSYSYARAELRLVGVFNARLCSRPPARGDWVPYELRFDGVYSFKVIELDCWDGDWPGSLVEMPRGAWIEVMNRAADDDPESRAQWPRIGTGYRHFFVQTYDHVFDVVAREIAIEVGEPREDGA